MKLDPLLDWIAWRIEALTVRLGDIRLSPLVREALPSPHEEESTDEDDLLSEEEADDETRDGSTFDACTIDDAAEHWGMLLA